jgi:hypothetical protein
MTPIPFSHIEQLTGYMAGQSRREKVYQHGKLTNSAM